jgi:TonB family protein
MADPRCVLDGLRLPRGVVGLRGETATVRFAVDPDGSVGSYEYLAGPADPRVAASIWTAVQRCRFTAGADAAGRPARLWLVMPVRFAR